MHTRHLAGAVFFGHGVGAVTDDTATLQIDWARSVRPIANIRMNKPFANNFFLNYKFD